MRVTATEASQLCNRSLWTIKLWARNGLPIERRGPFPDQWFIETDDLLAHATTQLEAYRNRRFIPGPGRGHKGPTK